MSHDGRASVASVSDQAGFQEVSGSGNGGCAAGTRNRIIPFAKLSDVQDGEPTDRKCVDCGGDGVLTVFSKTTGEPLCTATCPTCGGTRYAP